MTAAHCSVRKSRNQTFHTCSSNSFSSSPVHWLAYIIVIELKDSWCQKTAELMVLLKTGVCFHGKPFCPIQRYLSLLLIDLIIDNFVTYYMYVHIKPVNNAICIFWLLKPWISFITIHDHQIFSLHLARKCTPIFVRGHYLFWVANSFLQITAKNNSYNL